MEKNINTESATVRLISGDCIEQMENLAREKRVFDLVLTDLPYGVTSCR